MPDPATGANHPKQPKYNFISMKLHTKTLALFILATSIGFTAQAQNVMVGGAAMYNTKDIVSNALNSKEHTTLVAAVKAADLVDVLQSKGPFTVFAPVNDAFENLPEGTVATLLKPENKATLAKILTYHVVAGKMDFNAITKAIKASKSGAAELTTVAGIKLYAMMNGAHNIQIKDEAGNIANISTYDVYQSNGVIHVLDKVLLPKM